MKKKVLHVGCRPQATLPVKRVNGEAVHVAKKTKDENDHFKGSNSFGNKVTRQR